MSIVNLASQTSEYDRNRNSGGNNVAISQGSPLQFPGNSPKTFTEIIGQSVNHYPGREVVFILPDGGEVIQTHAELKNQAECILGGLRSQGLKPGDLVLVYVIDRDFIATFWACILGGFLPVPMTPNLKRRPETQAQLQHAWMTLEQPLILASAAIIENGLVFDTPNFLPLTIVDDLLVSEPDSNWYPSRPDDLAYLVMSSGTTGIPKIVQMTHYVVAARHVIGQTRKLNADGKNIFLHWMPFSHSSGLQVVKPRWDRVIYVLTETVLQEPLRWLDIIDRYQVTNLSLPNFALGAIADRLLDLQQGSAQKPNWDLSTLRRIGVSTEAIVPRTARQFLELLMPYGLGPHALHPNYSMSEVGAITTANNWSALDIQENDRFVEVGTPDLGCSIRIVDEDGTLLQEGEVGHIESHSPVMTNGYYLDPERTASIFTTDGWFKTGDLGVLKNGQLTITGRHKDLIIINGRNYHSTEIESVAEGVEALEKGYTAACSTRLTGNNTDELVLFFHIKQYREADLSLILKQIRKTLNHELGVNPAYLLPMEKSAIPKTTSGKMQRLALKKRFEAGEFDCLLSQIAGLVQQSQQDAYVAPHTPTEEMLTTLWSALLKLEKVGIHDNFFELGGHSLLAAQLLSRIRQTAQLELPLHSLFTHPTIAELASAIDQTVVQPGEALPILQRLASTTAPLSFAQQRLWLLQKLEPESRAYHLTKILRLQGALNIEALQQTFTTLIARHEVLRTRFVQPSGPTEGNTNDGLPIQIVDPPSPFELPFIDLSTTEQPEDKLQDLLVQATRQRFDLAADPMLRANLVRLQSDEHVLLYVMHHIASDGWSMGVFKHELSVLYQAYAQGQANPLPELPIQYGDFAQWQRQWLSGEVLNNQLSYWKQQLAGAPPVLALPTDHPRPAHPSYQGSHVTFTLSPALTDRLKALSQKNGATLYMTLLAALNILLYRYSQQDDIVIGSPIASRNRPELEGLIGFFVNTLTLRTDLSGQPSFQELLERVRQVTLGAYAHPNIPFEELVATLKPERPLGYSPWFQVMFVFQNQPLRSLDLSGLKIRPFERQHQQGNVMFDITLFMEERRNGLRGKLVFKTDLFEPTTISRMVGHFQTLLEGVVTNPQQSIAELPLLAAGELQQRLSNSHQTRTVMPLETGIHQLFEAQAEKTPEAIALIHQDSQLTYQALNHRANYLANYLRSLGVGPETLVGLSIERSLEMIIGLLGILKAGAAYVPLDPTYPQERLAMMVADAQPQVIVTMQRLQGVLPLRNIPIVCLDNDWEAITQSSPNSLDSGSQSNNLAYVIYTSGSTGQPKGVMIEHRSLVNFVTAAIAEYEISAGDRMLQFASINFDTAAEEIFPALCTGATLVLRTDQMLSSPTHFIQQCDTLGLTVLDLPTAYWHQLTAELPTTHCPVPPSLRLVIIGGEVAIPEQVSNWYTWLNASPSLSLSPPPLLINTYGPTESTIVATAYNIPNTKNSLATIPIGQGFAHADIHLLDAHLQPVPIGVPGEIYIGGPGLARGYLNRLELTHDRFISHPFSTDPSAKLYKTGDLACYLADGNLKFLGRWDDQVKIRGFRIELGDIESALSQHPMVRQCKVLAREDDPGDRRLVGYVVVREDEAVTMPELREYLLLKLPKPMIPSAFVQLAVLPLTPNGKVDPRALPRPTVNDVQVATAYVAPRTSQEQQLAAIWCEVLKLEKVGIYDNFFELGGHSLLALQVMARLNRVFAQEIPLNLVFTTPTLWQMAEECDKLVWLAQGQRATIGLEEDCEEGVL